MSNEIEKIASESFQATFLKKILKLEKGKLEENHFVSSFWKQMTRVRIECLLKEKPSLESVASEATMRWYALWIKVYQ
jgi:hypothetical protein